MSRERKENGAPKSAGRIRKGSMALHKSSNLSSNWYANIDNATEEEKKKQYDTYISTGDFERDFTSLCYLTGLKLAIIRRKRVPSPQLNINDEKLNNGDDNDNDDISVPTTYVLSNSKYKYFKPHLEIETESLQNKDHIKDLYLRGWMVDSRILDIFHKCILGLEHLSVLKLWNAGLTNHTLTELGSCLELIPALKTLCLDGNSQVKEQKFHIFLKKSSKLNLEHLSLRHCDLNYVGASNIADQLKENDNLLTLNLSCNKLGDEGVSYLANSLRLNRTLISLNLASNDLGDEGAKIVSTTISTFPLTHDEIVERRRQQILLDEESAQEKVISPVQTTAGKYAKTPKKKDSKGKEKKGKANWDKLKNTSPSKLGKRKTIQVSEESLVIKDPLTGKARLIKGELWIQGNRALINLNLARNKITNIGLESLYTAIKYQSESEKIDLNRSDIGLINLSLEKNRITADDVYLAMLDVLKSRHPLPSTEILSD